MATLMIVDDDADMREVLGETLADLGHEPRLAGSGAEALALLDDHVDGVLLDLRMPGRMDGIEVLRRIRERGPRPPVVVLTAYASAENTIQAMRLGAFDHLTKPIGREALKALLGRMLVDVDVGTPDPLPASDGHLIGSSEAIRQVQKTVGLVADSEATVLIRGETGTGKELVARALHRFSGRAHGPFVPVNCAAIPADLMESELFGHVRGSFTGASSDRAGAFREAAGGSLFLDEIGDMPQPMQAKILRALQERVITPVGGKPVAVQVRVIAATHRDLAALVAAGGFRQDLFYRLAVVPITLPSLRDRPEDILPLARHFLALASRGRTGRPLSTEAEDRLLRHPWPGNVRELRNVIERASLMARGAAIGGDDLDLVDDGADVTPPGREPTTADTDLPGAVAQLEARMIRAALAAAGGNRAETARRLGVNRQLLYEKIRRYGIATDGVSVSVTDAVRKADDRTPPIADPNGDGDVTR